MIYREYKWFKDYEKKLGITTEALEKGITLIWGTTIDTFKKSGDTLSLNNVEFHYFNDCGPIANMHNALDLFYGGIRSQDVRRLLDNAEIIFEK